MAGERHSGLNTGGWQVFKPEYSHILSIQAIQEYSSVSLAPGWAHLIRGPIHAGFEIEVQVDEGSADEYQRHVVDTFYF